MGERSPLDETSDFLGPAGWRSWMMYPPRAGQYEVIEWLYRHGPDWMKQEPNVARLADLLAPSNAAWNVANAYWRPVM